MTPSQVFDIAVVLFLVVEVISAFRQKARAVRRDLQRLDQ